LLTPASRLIFRSAIAPKNKHQQFTISLDFHSKEIPTVTTYTCAVWQARRQPLVLVIHPAPALPAAQPAGAVKPTAASLREMEDKFCRIIEKIPMPICAYEIELPKRTHFMNLKFTEWFGYTIEDIPDMEHWKRLAIRDDPSYYQKVKLWYDELEKIRRGEISESRPIEFTVHCKNECIKIVEISFTVDSNLFYTTYNDITARKKFERALRENEQKFRNISEQLPIPIIVFSEKGDTRFLNNAFTAAFGYTRDDIPATASWQAKALQGAPNSNNMNWEKDIPHAISPADTIVATQYEVTCRNGEHKIVDVFISRANKNIYVAFNDISSRMKAERELKQSHRQLRELSAHMEHIREEERKHIAREIHDELGQQLTILKLDLLQISRKLPPEQTDMMQKMKEADQLLIETMRSIRKIATQLRPSILDTLGLVSALEWQSREFEKRFGITCVFESLLQEPVFSEQQATALFRIYQEALTNTARHAAATRVDAVLSQEGSRVVLEVRDNGKGFNPTDMAGKKTMGLVGMQERALMLDGTFSIDSAPGHGTYIAVSVPMLITNEEIKHL
jgi:PAS domain S-box-containing protein